MLLLRSPAPRSSPASRQRCGSAPSPPPLYPSCWPQRTPSTFHPLAATASGAAENTRTRYWRETWVKQVRERARAAAPLARVRRARSCTQCGLSFAAEAFRNVSDVREYIIRAQRDNDDNFFGLSSRRPGHARPASGPNSNFPSQSCLVKRAPHADNFVWRYDAICAHFHWRRRFHGAVNTWKNEGHKQQAGGARPELLHRAAAPAHALALRALPARCTRAARDAMPPAGRVTAASTQRAARPRAGCAQASAGLRTVRASVTSAACTVPVVARGCVTRRGRRAACTARLTPRLVRRSATAPVARSAAPPRMPPRVMGLLSLR